MLDEPFPDDFRNNVIDAWMAQQKIDKNDITALDRPAYMGTGGMGALEFRSAPPLLTRHPSRAGSGRLVGVARDVVHCDLDGNAHGNERLATIIRSVHLQAGLGPKPGWLGTGDR